MPQDAMFPPPITLEDHEHSKEENDGKSKVVQLQGLMEIAVHFKNAQGSVAKWSKQLM